MFVKVAFLDRDGVINEKAVEHDYIKSWEEFRFKMGAIEGIRFLNEHGYKVVIVTNQRGIARGFMTEQDLKIIHTKMLETLNLCNAVIDEIYYCPHDIGECDCRKPGIGMFLEAENKFRIDKKHSFLIGDSASDMQAGTKYGIKSYLLKEQNLLYKIVEKILLL